MKKPAEYDDYHTIDIGHIHDDFGTSFEHELNEWLNIRNRRACHEAHLQAVHIFCLQTKISTLRIIL